MIRNYIKTAFRNISRSKAYSAINIIGLAGGLSGFIIILLYLNHELDYDKWDPALSNTYRISIRNNTDISTQTPAPLGQLLVQKYPNTEAATSIMPNGDYEILVAAGDKAIYQKESVSVDSSFLKVFPYKLVKGNAATALNEPNAVVLSEEVAGKLFGDADPMGRHIKVYNSFDGVVTGVMREPATPSQLPVKMLIRDPYGKQNNFWANYSFETYIRLKHPDSESNLEAGINKVFFNERLKNGQRDGGRYISLFVDAVPNIHNFPKYGGSQFTTVSVLLVLAALLLLAGSINFSTLAIAKAVTRAKETGIRKVLGSTRQQLVMQFMTETALQCILSLCIAMVMVALALPYINESFDIHLSFFGIGGRPDILIQFIVCLTLVILLSGLYPALLLSGHNTAKVLRGEYTSGKRGITFRNSLIVIQFMISVFFIIGVLAVHAQMSYMENLDKGFSGEQVMRIQANQSTREEGFAKTRNMLLSIPGVVNVAKTTRVPGDREFADTSTQAFKYNGKEYRMASVKISRDYFNTLKISLLKGRQLTDSYADQHTRSAIINESAARKLSLADPVGKMITFPYCDSIPVQIVAVVKDFNIHGFETPIQPEVYTIGNDACMFQSAGAIVVKLSSPDLKQSVAGIEKIWKKIEPDFPIRYSFLDENFQQLFVSHIRLQKIIGFFAFIAIVISVMGLFALTVYYARLRTKEIGIRKVMGATVTQLTVLLSKEFLLLVLLAVVVVVPISSWLIEKWLQSFAYHIVLSWSLFASAGIIAILIALVTVSLQSLRAAAASPVRSLRND